MNTRLSPFYWCLMLALLLSLPACSGSSSQLNQPTGEQPQPLDPAAAFADIPFPTANGEPGVRLTSGAESATLDGENAFGNSLNSMDAGTVRNFNAGAGEISWATYRWTGLKDWHDLTELEFQLADLPETFYVGLADFEAGRWKWTRRGTNDGDVSATVTLDWPISINGINIFGECYCVIAFHDGVSATLNELTLNWLAPGAGPNAFFEATPNLGNAPFEVTFNGNGSTDGDGVGINTWEWDWEGDGEFDMTTLVPVINHTYIDVGEYHPVLRVTDKNDGLTDTYTQPVFIQGWMRSFGADAVERPLDIAAVDENIYAVGDVVRNAFTEYSGLLISYDANGNPRWQKEWTGGAEDDSFNGVAAIPGKGFVAVGTTENFGATETGAIIVRFDRFGNQLWARLWDTPGSDAAESVTIDHGGLIWVAGSSNGVSAGDDYDGFVLRYSADGQLQMEKKLSNGGSTLCRDIEANPFSGIFVAGASNAYDDGRVATVWKLDFSGNLLWEASLDSSYSTIAHGIALGPIGDIYISGSYWNNTDCMFTAGLNSNGTYSWVTGWEFEEISSGQGIHLKLGQFLNVTDLYVGTSVWDSDSNNASACLVHLDPDGTYNGAKQWLSGDDLSLTAISSGQAGATLLTGSSVAAAATQTTVVYPPSIFIGIDTHNATGALSNVSATKSDISQDSITLAGTHDTGGGDEDAWVCSVFAEDL